MGNALGGSWRGVLVAAGVAVLLFAVIMGLAVTGRLGDLKYWSFPGHPYPPTGYYINPFSGAKGDLISSTEAARMKADLVVDGNVELDALRTGDPVSLRRSATGNALSKLQQIISQNNTVGIFEQESVVLTRITVGHLTDPNDPSVNGCVEEVGSADIRRFSRANGQLVGEQRIKFDDRYWLVRRGDRYLITDVQLGSSDGPAQ